MKRSIHLLFIVILSVCLYSCTEDENGHTDTQIPEVIVLFSPNGLGDRGYNDNILEGVLLSAAQRGFIPEILCPDTYEESEKLFRTWLEEKKTERSLFVLATNEYEEMVLKYGSSKQGGKKDILLFETQNTDTEAYTFNLSMYGASYLAGEITASLAPYNESAILCANPQDKVLQVASTGFREGFHANGGSVCDTYFLAEDASGYGMSGKAYEKAAELSTRYAFIYPLAGGSNSGAYRYTREHKGLYTAGMDREGSALSQYIIYSVEKKVNRIVEKYLIDWMDEKEWAKHRNYNLKTGEIDVILASDYEESLGKEYNSLKQKAIEAETAYENKN